MNVKVRKVQLLLSHYHSILLVSDDARKRVESWGLKVEKEIKAAKDGAAKLRDLEAEGRSYI
ncbi:hypothetical protein ES703_57493 [subsurface metagenome]